MKTWFALNEKLPPETDWDAGQVYPVIGYKDGEYTVVTWTEGDAFDSQGEEVWIEYWTDLPKFNKGAV